MPLHERRPQLLSLSIKSSSASSSQNDEVRTPLPTSPFAWNQAQAPLIMTPDTPYFDMSSVGGMFTGKEQAVEIRQEPIGKEAEWTEEEDDVLSSYLSRPAASRAYPPGTLPPSDLLDSMTTQILSRLSRSSSISSLSSASSSDSDTDMDSDDTITLKRTSGWSHSWSATRARLFRIARLESREALGGHTRNKSESMVPVIMDNLVLPKGAVIGGASMSRQLNSMENIHGAEQTIDGAVKLSGALQGQAMSGSSVLHSTQDLSSPVAFEFGPSVFFSAQSSASTSSAPAPSLVLPRTAINRKLPPSFPMSKGLPRPSLLQRGRSYTGADLARERGHSRDTSVSSDDTMDGEDTPVDSPMSSGNSLSALPPYVRPSVRRSATSPTAFVFPQPQPMTAIAVSLSRRGSIEPDPITPLNQTTFPQSAIGLGNRVLTGMSDDSDCTPSATPAITLTMTSPVASPSQGSGPHLAPSFDFPATEFANLCIATPAPAAIKTNSSHIRRPTRPAPLTRSLSESTSLAGLAYPNPAQLPSSTSHPSGLNTHLGPTPTVTPISRPCLAMSTMDDGSSGSESTRETKRQRAMPFAGSSAAVFRPRLNPGLTVVVPNTGLGGMASDGLRSPFEHKAPGGGLKI